MCSLLIHVISVYKRSWFKRFTEYLAELKVLTEGTEPDGGMIDRFLVWFPNQTYCFSNYVHVPPFSFYLVNCSWGFVWRSVGWSEKGQVETHETLFDFVKNCVLLKCLHQNIQISCVLTSTFPDWPCYDRHSDGGEVDFLTGASLQFRLSSICVPWTSCLLETCLRCTSRDQCWYQAFDQ